MAEGYRVVFSGKLRDGVEPERARVALMKAFQIGEDQAKSILRGGEREIKKGLSEEKAARYLEVLTKVGMVARVVAPESTVESNATETVVLSPMEETMVITASPSGGSEIGMGADTGSSSSSDRGEVTRHPFRFTGQGGEYFKIWIVNVLLTILTLGIYSAWAKVRNNRYFYGNTHVAGGSFEYLAQPLAILKGRIIAVLLFLAYSFAGNFDPILGLVAALALLGGMPWLIYRSLAFRNRNTALRNIRFGFDGGYGGAAAAFLLWPFLGVLSFGLLLPYAIYKQDRYIVGNSRYGSTPFEFNARIKSYYKMFGGMLVIFIGGGLGVNLLFWTIGFNLPMPEEGAALPPETALAMTVAFIGILLVYLLAFAYFAARRHNIVYGAAALSDHGFEANMAPVRLAWIQISNWAATLATLGLARPWARVRLARYKAECLTLIAAGSLDAFIAAEEESVNAMGEEMGEAFDFDFGL